MCCCGLCFCSFLRLFFGAGDSNVYFRSVRATLATDPCAQPAKEKREEYPCPMQGDLLPLQCKKNPWLLPHGATSFPRQLVFLEAGHKEQHTDSLRSLLACSRPATYMPVQDLHTGVCHISGIPVLGAAVVDGSDAPSTARSSLLSSSCFRPVPQTGRKSPSHDPLSFVPRKQAASAAVGSQQSTADPWRLQLSAAPRKPMSLPTLPQGRGGVLEHTGLA